MKIKKDNYLTIQGWMRTELNLKGNELLVFALIYGFTQDKETKFTGSLLYITDWIGASKSTVKLVINKLIDKELLVKYSDTKNNITFCEYQVNNATIEGWAENRLGIPKIGSERAENRLGGEPKIGSYIYTNTNSIFSSFYDEQLEISKEDKNYTLYVKHIFGDNKLDRKFSRVLAMKDQLTFKQFEELQKNIARYNSQIDNNRKNISLREYIESYENGVYKNKSVYLTFNNWINRECKSNNIKL